MDLTPLINAVIALAAAAVTAFVIPWLRKKLDAAGLTDFIETKFGVGYIVK